MNEIIYLKDILKEGVSFNGWLYLKANNITLESECFFYQMDLDLSPESDDDIRKEFIRDRWISGLSAEEIEDVIDNTLDQLETPTQENFLAAFIFYLENDAFIEWD